MPIYSLSTTAVFLAVNVFEFLTNYCSMMSGIAENIHMDESQYQTIYVSYKIISVMAYDKRYSPHTRLQSQYLH